MTKPVKSRDANWDRDLAIWEAACRREPSQKIAERYGITRQRVNQIVKTMGGQVTPEARSEMIARTAQLYDEWLWDTAQLVRADPIPAFSNGRAILLDDGTPALDHSGRLAAMQTGLKITESWRKMIGLDQPAKVEVDQQVRYILENVDDADLT